MSSREVLLKVLNHQGVDRIPVVPFIHVNMVKAFYGDHDADVIRKTIEVYEHFGFDIIHRNCTPVYDELGPTNDRWQVDKKVETDGRDQTTTITIHTPDGDLTQVHRLVWVIEYDAEVTPVDYLIKSEKDFEKIEVYQPPLETIDVSPIASAKQALGNKGVTAPWVQGAFNHLAYYYRRLDDLLMDAMVNPAFYHRMMEYFLNRNLQIVSQYIEAGVDLLSYGGNIASGKMISGAFFREFVLPYEKRLIDYIQGKGVHVLYHNCGYARKLFRNYRDLGMRAYESLTAPPYGDTILEEAFELLPNDMILHGSMDQIEFLLKAQPSEIKSKVDSILGQAKTRGNFILGTSDYFHEQTPRENIAALAEAAHEFGTY
ncbi:MAG: uroporphyrinogen decarboxylase family protein [Planctomycetota bacterium]|jgi:uroporphyrinogen-III decarboxylase